MVASCQAPDITTIVYCLTAVVIMVMQLILIILYFEVNRQKLPICNDVLLCRASLCLLSSHFVTPYVTCESESESPLE